MFKIAANLRSQELAPKEIDRQERQTLESETRFSVVIAFFRFEKIDALNLKT